MMSLVTANMPMGRRIWGIAALSALLFATGPAPAVEHVDGAATNCGAEKPFREVAEDETRRMADICMAPPEMAHEETADPALGTPDALRSLASARD
jgi:hypothetical protein